MSKRKSNKFVFTLHNVNTELVDQKYGISIVSNISSVDIPDNNVTRLSELTTDTMTPDTISFLDESKKIHQCTISMIDYNSNMDTILLRHNCFWCKHSFETTPIGCPIKYIPNQAVKTYYSEISKDIYVIREDITANKNIEDERINIIRKEYYETDGIFCSFNCCKAYIDDNKHNKLYNQSMCLLAKIYKKMTNVSIPLINPAPHWRLLQAYGGHMSVSEFRNSFNKADYDYHGIVHTTPSFRSIGYLFEEKIKF